MERWKKIEGYENYSVSSEGRVRNDRTGRLMSLTTEPTGYLRVGLCKNGKYKRFYVHRLVAEAFIPNPHNFPQVNHLNETKTTNIVENLEWCDRKHNMNYGTRNYRSMMSQPTRKTVVVDGRQYDSIKSAEKYLGIPKGCLVDAFYRGQNRYKGHTISYL